MGLPRLAPRPYARTTLRPRHRAVVRALLDAYFYGDDTVTASTLDALVDEADRFMSPASKTLRFGLLVMLDVVRWAPLFVIGRCSAFESLAFEDKTRMITAMERSKIVSLTLIAVAYKTLLTILFFETAEGHAIARYPGDVRLRYKRSWPPPPLPPPPPPEAAGPEASR